MRTIKKILIDQKSGKKYFIKDLKENFHTQNGTISSWDLKSSDSQVTSNKGCGFKIIEPSFVDLWENLNRGPQIVQQKDIGLIISKTGIGKNSLVVDAGGGSGSLCLSLANVCKNIVVYEINQEHYDVIAKNIEMFGVDNINLKQANVYEGIEEREIDLITLDLPEPWQVVSHAQESLKPGGFLVVYLPNLHQVKRFLDSLRGSPFKILEITELLQRQWKITDKIMRPEFEMLGHTGFLVFCRKL